MTAKLNDRQLAALRTLVKLHDERLYAFVTAQDVAAWMGVTPTRRHGNGAVRGSWSGSCAVGFHMASTLRALERRGLASSFPSGRERYVTAYAPTRAGREVAHAS